MFLRVIALVVGLVSALSAAQDLIPPVPLPGSSPPSFPQFETPEPVEAIATVRADVDATGVPTRVSALKVEVLGAPAAKREEMRAAFEAEARGTVSTWRFTPAHRGTESVAGVFVGTLTFTAPGTVATARMYAASSAAAWSGLRNALASLKAGTTYVNDQEHYLTTKWLAADSAAGRAVGSFGLGANVKVRRFMLVAFVSPFVEPARVHVHSIVEAENRGWKKGEFVLYNIPAVSEMMFRLLEGIAESRPLPISEIARAELARTLAPERSGCEAGLAEEHRERDPNHLPKPLHTWRPYYPAESLAQHRTGVVTIQGRLFEDGTLLPISVIHRPPENDLTSSALGAASLWHFRPGMVDDCARPQDIMMELSFAIRP